MTNKVFLVVGVPGSGKTWVCNQLWDRFEHVPHDEHIGADYVDALIKRAERSPRPLLAEAPFSVSQIAQPLSDNGLDVTPVFILEEPEVLADRYHRREGRDIPKGHLTRQNTYAERARQWDAFSGTSSEVLQWLKKQ